MKRKIQLIAAFIVISMAILACGSTTTVTKVGVATAISTESNNLSANTKYKVRDIIQFDSMTMTVNSVSTTAGTTMYMPESGKKFIIVDLTFENKGTYSENISSLLQMSLKDDTGQGYTEDLSATLSVDGNSPEGEVTPGEKLRGQIGFQVPTSAKGLLFVFEPNILNNGKIFVDLGQ